MPLSEEDLSYLIDYGNIILSPILRFLYYSYL